MEKRNQMKILLEKLKEDSKEYKDLRVGEDREEQKNAIRSLMNVRMPREIPGELLRLQDAYLQEELDAKGIVELSDIPTVREKYGSRISCGDHISLWQGDITRLRAGGIVNAANSQMLGCFIPCHRCIDNAIHSAAGMQLREECHQIMERRRMRHGGQYQEPTGTATLTKAYNLPCDYVIHTVGPIVYGELNDRLRQDLRHCYENVLKCCVENGIRSVAFCCISTGEFHFPREKAAKIAVDAVASFLETGDGVMERVIFNVFQDRDREVYEEILG